MKTNFVVLVSKGDLDANVCWKIAFKIRHFNNKFNHEMFAVNIHFALQISGQKKTILHTSMKKIKNILNVCKTYHLSNLEYESNNNAIMKTDEYVFIIHVNPEVL